jgi:hypothetical protein
MLQRRPTLLYSQRVSKAKVIERRTILHPDLSFLFLPFSPFHSKSRTNPDDAFFILCPNRLAACPSNYDSVAPIKNNQCTEYPQDGGEGPGW